LVASLALVAGALATARPARAATPGPLVPVIIQYGTESAAETAVRDAGGTVTRRLDLIHALAATVPATTIGRLAVPGVLAVTPDTQVRLKGDKWKADGDPTSLYSITKTVEAQSVWSKIDAQGRTITGKGVGVALIDSGVTPVPGLSGSTKVINGPDLSFESQASNLRYLDTFGHGTHMAGIIAGRDTAVKAGAETDNKNFVGIAPDAQLISLKVAAADGATDVSQVIAAIDWVVQHRNDPGLNIRVLNLSFGTDSTQDPRLDPLSYAVEAAWRSGIVVVVSVGNDGSTATRVAMPAQNPYVISVGAANSNATEGPENDTVATFSSRGNSTRHADLVAPGRSVASLRDPGSYIDVNYPTGLIPTDTSQRFFRGSGTSQATAVVSGAAALLLQQRPSLTPDQVKRLLMTTTQKMPLVTDTIASGAGQLDVKNAVDAATPAYTQTFTASTGTGSLERSRGTSHVADPTNGVELTGEKDIMGQSWNPTTWTKNSLAGCAWTGGTWNSRTWSGSSWTGTSWTARTWSSGVWAGADWAGVNWAGRTWSSAMWDGRTWSARTWSGRTWSGASWTNGAWSAATWG
jgi:serine protease AprX